MQLILIEVEATYPRTLPANFQDALKEEITRHLKAYGCDVRKCDFVTLEHATIIQEPKV